MSWLRATSSIHSKNVCSLARLASMQVPDDEDEAGMLTIRDNRIEVSASRQPFTMSLTTEGSPHRI